MKFVKVSIGSSVSIHDVKVYERRKTEKITADILGDDKSYCRLTGSQRFGKYYAYFPMEGYNPAEKEAYVELTFDEYTLIATGKEKLNIVESDKPTNYAKRLTGYYTRIDSPEFAAIVETAKVSEEKAEELQEKAEETGPIEEKPAVNTETPAELPKEPEAKAPNRRKRAKA